MLNILYQLNFSTYFLQSRFYTLLNALMLINFKVLILLLYKSYINDTEFTGLYYIKLFTMFLTILSIPDLSNEIT